MSRKKTIVKDLNAIQNFGAMNILCTDKTGTLTCDQIVLERYINADGSNDTDKRILRHAYFNSFFQTGLKNLMDKAILSPFFFEAAMQTVTRSLLYGISSYTLYYARQPQHDMNRPRIYCFKKNKDPFHEGKE